MPNTKFRKARTSHRPDGSGLDVEAEFLGIPLQRLTPSNPPEYLPYMQALVSALQDVQNRRIWSPHKPNTPMAREIFNEVLKMMKSQRRAFKGLQVHHLAFYPTNGTAFDFWHGVDAVVILEKTWFATLDVSLRDNKMCKADVLINPFNMSDADTFGDYCQRIVSRLKWKKKNYKDVQPLLI